MAASHLRGWFHVRNAASAGLIRWGLPAKLPLACCDPISIVKTRALPSCWRETSKPTWRFVSGLRSQNPEIEMPKRHLLKADGTVDMIGPVFS